MRLGPVVLACVACAACDDVYGLDRTYVADAAPDSALDVPDAGPMRYRDVVLADQPLAYWRFGADSAAQAIDETGHGHDGTYAGGATRGPGAIGTALDSDTAVVLDGIDDHVMIGNKFAFSGLAPFTLEAWIKHDGGTNTGGILSKSDETGGMNRRGYLMFLHPSFVGVERSITDGAAQTATTSMLPARGTWAHIVATFDGTLLTMYRDAIAVVVVGGTPISVPATLGDFVIGARGGGTQERFKGAVDEVAIYDRALTGVQIGAHLAARDRE